MEACLSGSLSHVEMQTELRAISDGVIMIATLTNDMLALQKMRTGGFSIAKKAAAPARMVEACVRAVQPAVCVPIEVRVEDCVPAWVRRCSRHNVMRLVQVTAMRMGAHCRCLRTSFGCARLS